jgi:hypothetical protein
MKDKSKGPSQPPGQAGRPKNAQRGGRRAAPGGNSRSRQFIAVGALALILAVIAAVVIYNQNQPSASGTGVLPGEANGHARGSATAAVTVTEWSDFQ